MSMRRRAKDQKAETIEAAMAQADFSADDGKNKAAQWLGQRGGKARAKALSPERRKAIAKKAAKSRWHST
jgi:hypothetical protein